MATEQEIAKIFRIFTEFEAMGHELYTRTIIANSDNVRFQLQDPHWDVSYEAAAGMFIAKESRHALDRTQPREITFSSMAELSDFLHAEKKAYAKRMMYQSNNRI